MSKQRKRPLGDTFARGMEGVWYCRLYKHSTVSYTSVSYTSECLTSISQDHSSLRISQHSHTERLIQSVIHHTTLVTQSSVNRILSLYRC